MPSRSEGLPLVSYALMVRRRWLLVLVIVLAMVAPAVAWSLLQTPQYKAVGQMLLTRQQLDENYNVAPGVLTDTQVNNEVALLTSAQVADRAIKLGATAPISATGQASSNVVTVTASDTDRQNAAATVTAYLKAYSDYRTDVVKKTLDGTAQQLQATVTDLQKQIEALNRNRDAGFADRTILQQQQSTVQARLRGVEIQQTMISPGVTIVQPAEVPQEPFSPTPVRNGLFALVLALILGISLAVLLESFKQRAEPLTGPLPVSPQPVPQRPSGQNGSPRGGRPDRDHTGVR